MKYLNTHKCNHHVIVHKYLTFYLYLKNNRSILSDRLKDVAKTNTECFSSKKKKITLQSNQVTYNMKYLVNTPFHYKELMRHITSKFIVTETKVDWSSGFSIILYCFKTELKYQATYSLFRFRRDMHNKFNGKPFIDMLK